MQRTIRFLLLASFLHFLSPPVLALELFGVNLTDTGRDQLRTAVKKAGAKLITEAGKDGFFDSYDSSGLMPNSSRLYLGFADTDQRFAFAEYEFNGLQQPALLQKLVEKYGKPVVKSGKFLTDSRYLWQTDGVDIMFYSDWEAYRSRLIYSVPAQLQRLREAKRAKDQQQNATLAEYQESAY